MLFNCSIFGNLKDFEFLRIFFRSEYYVQSFPNSSKFSENIFRLGSIPVFLLDS